MIAVENKKTAELTESKTDKEKLAALATTNRKLTVGTIKQLDDSKAVDSIVKTYERMDDAAMNRNDKARQKAAIARQRFLAGQEADSKAFTESMKPKPVQVQKETLVQKKKQLSKEDKKLLAIRKKARGGQTMRQRLSDEATLKTHQKEGPLQKKVDLRPPEGEQVQSIGQERIDEVPPIPGTTLNKPIKTREITGVQKPVGQSSVPGKPHIGKVFSRDHEYVEQGGRSDAAKEIALNSNNPDNVNIELGLNIIEYLEKDIYNGDW